MLAGTPGSDVRSNLTLESDHPPIPSHDGGSTMFEQLFKQPHALARHRNGPLAEERRRYLAHCAEQQMSRRTLRRTRHLHPHRRESPAAGRPARRTHHTGRDRGRSRPLGQPTSQTASDARGPTVHGSASPAHATRWLTFLGRLQPSAAAPRPYAEHVAQFSDYMLQERGLSPRPPEYRCRDDPEFLALGR